VTGLEETVLDHLMNIAVPPLGDGPAALLRANVDVIAVALMPLSDLEIRAVRLRRWPPGRLALRARRLCSLRHCAMVASSSVEDKEDIGPHSGDVISARYSGAVALHTAD
jgi:hypothetical protein